MANMAQNGKYTGEEKIVISMDVGTTHSAVSYAYLYPHTVPEVRMVTKWAGQPDAMGDSKIPTILAYQKGTLVACGAEARDFIGDDEYNVARWFKLHLHPESMEIPNSPSAYGSNTSTSIQAPSLPAGITLKQLYVDFFRYLFNAVKGQFESDTPNGSKIWNRLSPNMTIVLAIPNGWDITQQGFLKAAAIQAELVTQTTAETCLEFVTEGEASVHYVLEYQKHNWLSQGSAFLVVDAGGSTVDSTLYQCETAEPKLVLKEMCASECVQAGGIFVDHAARMLLSKKLDDSPFSDDDYLDTMVEVFEKNTKRLFNGTQESNVIQFGGSRDNDRSKDIIKGRLSLSRVEVQITFEAVLSRILESVVTMEKGRGVEHVLLVGGFGESPYLRNRLRDYFEGRKTEVVTVDEPSKKAAAEGATIWYIKQLVTSRIARVTIGIHIAKVYDPDQPEHSAREHQVIEWADGVKKLWYGFQPWVEKGEELVQEFSQTFNYWLEYDFYPTAESIHEVAEIFVWEGSGTPLFIYDTNARIMPGMRKLCSLQIDRSLLAPLFQEFSTTDGKKYWRLIYKVVIRYNGTRLTATMQWEDREKLLSKLNILTGKVRESAVTVIPNSAF